MKTVQKQNRPWHPPALRYKGTVGEVLKGGGGKLSAIYGDPGENRCPTPQECAPTYE